MTSPVFERFLSTADMLAVFDARSIVGAMLDFEAALALAQAEEGVIPAAAGPAIAAACRVDAFDLDAIVAASGSAGTLAIPLVRRLTAAVAAADAAGGVNAAGYVHWGSTSQDVIDTAMVLATRRALALLGTDLDRLIDAAFALERRHGAAPVLARTLMQPAQVIGFGFKLVSWIAPLVRSRERLGRAAAAALQLQLGGAVGTLAVMGERGAAVARRVAAALDLGLPPGAWHTQRDTWVALGCEVGLLCGTLGKIATDVALLAQGEVGEVAEPSGGGGSAGGEKRGGSSAMPHKRNPVASMIALAAAARSPHRVAALLGSMAQQHERGLGNWQAELAEWPGLFASAHGALRALAEALEGLEVDAVRMRANIDALQGLVYAEGASMLLARHVGKSRAHGLLEALSRRVVAEKRHLRELTLEAVAADATLAAAVAPAEVEAVFDADAAARRANALARPQLDALAAARPTSILTRDDTP